MKVNSSRGSNSYKIESNESKKERRDSKTKLVITDIIVALTKLKFVMAESTSNKLYLVYRLKVYDEDTECEFIALYKDRMAAKAYVNSLVDKESIERKAGSLKSLEYFRSELETLQQKRADSTTKPEKYQLGLRINETKDQLQLSEGALVKPHPGPAKDVDAADYSEDRIEYGTYKIPYTCRNSMYIISCIGGYYCIEPVELRD